MIKRSVPTLWLVTIAALLLGGYLCIGRPLEQRCADLQRDIAARQATLALLTRSTTAMGDSSMKADKLRKAVSEFETKLPADGQIDKVLEDIWRMAQANSLRTRTVKTPAVQLTSGYGEQTMELSVAGDFAGFYQFVLQLEEAKHVMRIKKMHLSKAGNREGEVQADVTLCVYFQPVRRPL